jgi:LacI family transcriptional regulator
MMEHIPLILFDRISTKVPCTQIIIDDEDAAFKAVEHLINIGKTRIAIIKNLITLMFPKEDSRATWRPLKFRNRQKTSY